MSKQIEIKNVRTGKTHKFDPAHALNLLRLQQQKPTRKGWELVDKNYTFEQNEIIKRPSNRKAQEASNESQAPF